MSLDAVNATKKDASLRGGTQIAGPTTRPTMKDVAIRAGVGLKTVSRVVNNEKHVSEDVRLRVEKAVLELGFRRNAGAASLRRGHTGTIGLIVEDISEPFQSMVARAVERVALAQGVLLFTASSSQDEQRAKEMALALCGRRVDGLLLLTRPYDQSFLQAEIDAGLPVVFVDRPPMGLHGVDTVISANRDGARAGVQHLIAHGHRRIAFIGDPEDIYTGHERLSGYRDALKSAGIPYDPAMVHLGEPLTERCQRALSIVSALPDPATAVFTGNSLNTLATLRTAAHRTRPLAHVAFDDFECADLLHPPLSVVAQDPSGMGTIAAELITKRIKGEKGPARELILPTALIPRGSGERLLNQDLHKEDDD
jgi:LacI family transcriptional regulator